MNPYDIFSRRTSVEQERYIHRPSGRTTSLLPCYNKYPTANEILIPLDKRTGKPLLEQVVYPIRRNETLSYMTAFESITNPIVVQDHSINMDEPPMYSREYEQVQEQANEILISSKKSKFDKIIDICLIITILIIYLLIFILIFVV